MIFFFGVYLAAFLVVFTVAALVGLAGYGIALLIDRKLWLSTVERKDKKKSRVLRIVLTCVFFIVALAIGIVHVVYNAHFP